MDIPRTPPRSRFRSPWFIIVALGVVAALFYVSRIPAALLSANRDALLIGKVERGAFAIEVKANGILEPVDLRIITAQTNCVVARIHEFPGAAVQPDTLIAELESPELEQAVHDAMWQLRSAEADYELQHLDQKTAVSTADGAAKEAQAKLEAYLLLEKKGLYQDNSIDMLRVRVALEEANANLAAAQARLRFFEGGGKDSTIAPAKAKLEQARSMYALKKAQFASLQVRAGMDGILQQLPIQVGARCTAGSTLAIVAKPSPLKAVLKVEQIQAKDVRVGQSVVVDTYNGKVKGRVIRADPSIRNGTMAVDVAFDSELPPGARPDLSVEGTILVDNIPNGVFVGRPSLVQAHSAATVFRVSADGQEAARTPVHFGRGSDTRLEVLDGISPGQEVILSDTSAWHGTDRIRLH